MWQTLFHIPPEFLGVPVFGVGWALALFVIGAGLYLAVQLRRHGADHEFWGYVPVVLLVSAALVFVLPRLEQIENDVSQGIPIRGYGVMMLLGIVAAVSLAAYRARRMGVDPEHIYSLAFYVFVFGVVGARMFFVIQYWSEFRQGTFGNTLAAILNITQGGLVVYGALIGAVVALVVVVRQRGLPALALCDLIAPSLALGLAIGRLGCLMNGCCYGGPCSQPWAVSFPPESPPYEDQLRSGRFFGFRLAAGNAGQPVVAEVQPDTAATDGGLKVGDVIVAINGKGVHDAKDRRGATMPALRTAQQYIALSEAHLALTLDGGRQVNLQRDHLPHHSLAIHPTQIYSSINALLLCLLLLAYYPFRRRDGEVIALMLTIYPVTRFLIEIIRSDEGARFGTGMTISQNVSLAILVFVAGLWLFISRRPRGTAWPPEAVS